MQQGRGGRIVPFFLSFVAGCAALGFGDESGLVLVVPGCQTALHVAVELPAALEIKEGSAWQLAEIGGRGSKVAAQLVPSIADDGSGNSVLPPLLLAEIPPAQFPLTQPRRFRLENHAAEAKQQSVFRFVEVGDIALRLTEGEKPVYAYNYGFLADPRAPEDKKRLRSCYIHPLWGLDGEVLTDDFPPDHYYHHGLFWAWPYVTLGEKQYDQWTYVNTAFRFERWLGRNTGPPAAVLVAENGWYADQRKIMAERIRLCCFRAGAESRVLDMEFAWLPLEGPLTLRGRERKGYGGLSVRFAGVGAQNPLITTPAGPTAEELVGVRLAWADFSATFRGAEGPSGAALFVPPQHPNFPLTWLLRYTGTVCAGWPGPEGRTFAQGERIYLKYRLWIHKGLGELNRLKEAYEAYVASRECKWE